MKITFNTIKHNIYSPIRFKAEYNNRKSMTDIAKMCGLYSKRGIGNVDTFFAIKSDESGSYIDTSSGINASNYAYLSSIRPYSFTKEELVEKEEYSQARLKELIKDSKIKPVSIKTRYGMESYIPLYNTKDSKNKEQFERLRRISPKKSKYIRIPDKPSFVPLAYLEKLGYGTHEDIVEAVKFGEIKPIKKRTTIKSLTNPFKLPEIKDIYWVETTTNADATKLLRVRDDNENLYEIKRFSYEFGITESAVREAIMNGELEIIPEYIFPEEANKLFIDLNNPKNMAYVDKFLSPYIKRGLTREKAIEESRKKPRTYQLFKTKNRLVFMPRSKKKSKKFIKSGKKLCY